MTSNFADRINDVPKSFIREILKVGVDPNIISFAGGLPNRDFFPVEEIKNAAVTVLDTDGKDALQYSTTEGYLPLRKYIAQRYRTKKEIEISPDEILITTGSQQGLDLLGKTLINEGDNIIIEKPGYLGAIQTFSVYRAAFNPVPLNNDGVDIAILKQTLAKGKMKIFYGVPNFQNPSGITYSDANRRQLADALKNTGTLYIEDDPYGDLRFMGKDIPCVKTYLPESTVMLGSFSKTITPSMRIGWITAPGALMEKLIIAKQASDLHTNYFAQRIIHQYLTDNDLNAHIAKINTVYRRQRDAMVQAIKRCMPEGIAITEPEGGMFLWMTLPAEISLMDLFNRAIKENVAFVPGNPFYANQAETNTLRLNFSCVDESTTNEGISRLAAVIKSML